MAKKGNDRNGKKKASAKKQASPKRPTRKQQHTKGSPYRVPVRLAYVPDNMFSWGERLPATRDDHVPPDMSSMMTVWNPKDPQPTTSATDQPSSGQVATDVPVAASSDVRAREEHDTREISSANPAPHALEAQAEEATPNRIPASSFHVYGALLAPVDQSTRFLAPVPLPDFHPHSLHAALDASPSPRFHPYHPPRPRFSSWQTTQLEESYASMNGGANPSHSRDIPQTVTASRAQVQVRSTSLPFPQPFVDPATGAWFWPGNPAALQGVGIQTQTLGLDIGQPPARHLHGHAAPPLQEPFAYPLVVLPEETSFVAQSAVAGPSSQPQEDALMADHAHLYHAGNARPRWGVPQRQLNPDWPSQLAAGPSQYEASPAELGSLDVEGPCEFLTPEYWPGSSPPPPSGSQWP